jgi:hypothetical protein
MYIILYIYIIYHINININIYIYIFVIHVHIQSYTYIQISVRDGLNKLAKQQAKDTGIANDLWCRLSVVVIQAKFLPTSAHSLTLLDAAAGPTNRKWPKKNMGYEKMGYKWFPHFGVHKYMINGIYSFIYGMKYALYLEYKPRIL